MKILLTGATGFIGQELGIKLAQCGHQLIVVTRNIESAKAQLPFPCELIECDLMKDRISSDLLKEIQIIIHLAGENIGEKRWSNSQKKRIVESRTLTAQNLYSSFPDDHKIQTIIQSSAIGFYGDRGGEDLNEESSAGGGFLSLVCQQWEKSAKSSIERMKNSSQIRTVYLRAGVVFSEFGGALEKMVLPFKYKIGGSLGDGQQYISWIHISDLIKLYIWILSENKASGIVNAVSPDPVTNNQFSSLISKLFNSILFPAVPAYVLKLALGEMSELVLSSQKVLPAKLIKNNFKFEFDNLEKVLKSVCESAINNENLYRAIQYVPVKIDQVFSFFSDANNLEKITPSDLEFKIKSISTEKIQKNTKIIYQLKVHKIPLRWVTNIEIWEPNNRFVDNQVSGPYRKWHHTHEFFELQSGTIMVDTVRYKLPFGMTGQILAGWFVKNDVNEIFKFRRLSILKWTSSLNSKSD